MVMINNDEGLDFNPVSAEEGFDHESVEDTFVKAYASARWTTGRLLEWGFGMSRGICKELYGDAIPVKELEPVYAFGQKSGGLCRISGFYGADMCADLETALKDEGFTTTTSGTLTVQAKSQSKGQTIPRGTTASVGSFTVRPYNVPFWRPEVHRQFFLKDECVLKDGYIEFNLIEDQRRITPHGMELVRKPSDVELPTNLAELLVLAETLGIEVKQHPLGVFLKQVK